MQNWENIKFKGIAIEFDRDGSVYFNYEITNTQSTPLFIVDSSLTLTLGNHRIKSEENIYKFEDYIALESQESKIIEGKFRMKNFKPFPENKMVNFELILSDHQHYKHYLLGSTYLVETKKPKNKKRKVASRKDIPKGKWGW